jgi:hypothetical protein
MGPLQYQQPTKLILLKITIFSLISSETGEVGLGTKAADRILKILNIAKSGKLDYQVISQRNSKNLCIVYRYWYISEGEMLGRRASPLG